MGCCLHFNHIYFNPRSHERSDIVYTTNTILIPYFNPRSHERSDNTRTVVIVVLDISIHAPTRGATTSEITGTGDTPISIHAPTRGATSSFLSTFSSFYFNPRSHERSDSNIAQKICLFLYNTDNKYIIR